MSAHGMSEAGGLREGEDFRRLGAAIHRFRCANPDCRHYDDKGYFTPRDNDAASAVIASDWLAAREAAAEQRGREDNADHGMCYVHGSAALAAREAKARAEAGEQAWDEGWMYAFEDHGPMNGNPYRAARIAREVTR